jgi:hypothetical protein
MSIIWIFREMRSGSTAFAETLAERLNLPYVATESFSGESHPITIDTNVVLSTHSFHALSLMEFYQDPILIRCIRRDRAEQCISHLIATSFNKAVSESNRFWNMRRDESKNTNRNTFDSAEPLTFTKKEVFTYLDLNQSWKTYWDTYAHKYRNYTVYYEDLCEKEIDIPEIGVYSFSIRDNATTHKLPDYKNRICLNHLMIRKWVDEYESKL